MLYEVITVVEELLAEQLYLVRVVAGDDLGGRLLEPAEGRNPFLLAVENCRLGGRSGTGQSGAVFHQPVPAPQVALQMLV